MLQLAWICMETSRKKLACDKAEALRKEKADESKAEASGCRPPKRGSSPDLPDHNDDGGDAGGHTPTLNY